MIDLQFSPQAQLDLVRLEAFLWDAGDPLAAELMLFVLGGLAVLTQQPGIGRPTADGLRELIISRGRGGYLATYQFDAVRQRVRILRIRHQREAGYTEEEI
ncbi:MAG: type II toxin-antitoxin system RelE/ParE family toxin [Hydrogenophaga sp.]